MSNRREFLRDATMATLALAAAPASDANAQQPAHRQPNIIMFLADDMGFSDVGCQGGEIETPNPVALRKAGCSSARSITLHGAALRVLPC